MSMLSLTRTADPLRLSKLVGMEPTEQQFISIRLPVTTVRQAEEQAKAEDRSRSSLIRLALSEYIATKRAAAGASP